MLNVVYEDFGSGVRTRHHDMACRKDVDSVFWHIMVRCPQIQLEVESRPLKEGCIHADNSFLVPFWLRLGTNTSIDTCVCICICICKYVYICVCTIYIYE